MIETLCGVSTVLFCVVFLLETDGSFGGQMYDDDNAIWTTAWVNITYKNPYTGQTVSQKEESGRYGTGLIRHVKGWVIHTKPKDGCGKLQNDFAKSLTPWIALTSRGNCTFSDKVSNASAFNASGVVVYNNQENEDLLTMTYKGDLTAIIISLEDGLLITSLLDNGTKVYIEISVGTRTIQRVQVSKTSVLFVSISFIVLMVISLAWLVFYYIQRFRYTHARDKSQKRLGRAAKKAIAKLPQRTLKDSDPEIQSDMECCAVCIELYKAGDVIRKLPCKHYFHKGCVDQWLIEHRTCPMCKLNILKALGHDIQERRVSLIVEVETATTGSNNGNETEEESLGNDDHTAAVDHEESISSSNLDIARPRSVSAVDLEEGFQDDSPEGIQNLMLVWVPEDVLPANPNSSNCTARPTDGVSDWNDVNIPTDNAANRRSVQGSFDSISHKAT
ncbi:RING finger protein 150-like [Glandiceps talaboti]